MKTTLLILFIAAFPFFAEAADGLSISLIHPDSKALLAKHGKQLPESISKDYRLLYESNTGIGNGENDPSVNGLLVARNVLLTQKDFIGYEIVWSASGNIAGIIHLKFDSRDLVAERIKEHIQGTFALVIDDEWVYYDARTGEIRPAEGLVVIPVLDQRDGERFLNLANGKRGMHADDPIPKEEVPASPLEKADQ